MIVLNHTSATSNANFINSRKVGLVKDTLK